MKLVLNMRAMAHSMVVSTSCMRRVKNTIMASHRTKASWIGQSCCLQWNPSTSHCPSLFHPQPFDHSSPTRKASPPSFHRFIMAVSCRAGGVGDDAAITDTNREILVQHILLKEDRLSLLLELQHKITQEGIDLSDLAVEYSECSSKSEGGMLGWIRRGQLIPEIEEAAFASPLNKLIKVKSNLGWHLLQVISEREASFLEEIQPEELHTRLQDPSFLEESQLIDVREPYEISAAAIQGFKAYPLSEFGEWSSHITSDLDPSKDTYVICHHGIRSMQAAKWLQSQGFQRLYNVSGGLHAYSMRADSSIPVY